MNEVRRVWAIVPVKAFARSKSRLSEVLGEHERTTFARGLCEHVLSELAQTKGIDGVLVITDDDEVAAYAAQRATEVQRDPLPCLGLAQIVDSAQRRVLALGGVASLVCMADLPALSRTELADTLQLLETHQVVVAPDLEGQGTNLLAMRPALVMPSCFGRADSFAQHLSVAQRSSLTVAVQRAPGICFDVDQPAELLRLRSGAQPQLALGGRAGE